ncbi:MAG: methionyl-tRNA formyltransferase [Elusimicrobiota bacterium]
MKLLFFGSPAVAVPFLEACVRGGHEVPFVVTQPDRPAGRGLGLKPPPVKAAAQRLGLRVLQPEKLSAIREEVAACGADAAVVVAYGRFFGPKFLASTRLGFLNVHFSLLPKYRGAAPVQWTLIRGDKRAGVTLFWIVKEMDAGPVQRRAALDVGADEDAPALFKRLIDLGARELAAALADISAGRVRREKQEDAVTLAPKLTEKEARLDFGLSAPEMHNRVRGLRGGPRAFLMLNMPGRSAPLRLTVLRTTPDEDGGDGVPGTIVRVADEKGILIQCSAGRCWIAEVQPEGKKPLKAVDFLNGIRLQQGDLLSAAA